jgi:hypothetical protein
MSDAAKSATEPSEHHMQCGCHGPRGVKGDSATRPRDEVRSGGSALDILDERFARGEMDKAEYSEKKQLISQRASDPKADPSEQASDAPKSGSDAGEATT